MRFLHYISFIISPTLALCALNAQGRIDIPDIPGYKTLQCDFHMHSVFSDGVVWPTVRVDEAAREGLDGIAITDHLERRRHVADTATSRNIAHDTAAPVAKSKKIILIRGSEITHGMPPGHLNAIFLKDCNALYHEDWRDSLAEAKRQGAFIIWNHPGWDRQQAHTTRWWPEHDEILKNGWVHGIEVANGGLYTPEAFQWALDKKLAIIGASDAHQPTTAYIDFAKNEHRSFTIVFARERTAAGIREALDNRRTAAFFREYIYGEEQWLRPLFEKSVAVRKISHVPAEPRYKARTTISIKNNSGLLFRLKKIVPGEDPVNFREYIIKPNGQATINIGNIEELGANEVSFQVTNLMTTPKTPLIWTVKIPNPPPVKE